MARNGKYYTKELLYLEIKNLRDYMGIRACDYPLDMKSVCRQGGLEINTYPFTTKGLQGMLTIDADGVGYITLNAHNSPSEQNFFVDMRVSITSSTVIMDKLCFNAMIR